MQLRRTSLDLRKGRVGVGAQQRLHLGSKLDGAGMLCLERVRFLESLLCGGGHLRALAQVRHGGIHLAAIHLEADDGGVGGVGNGSCRLLLVAHGITS